MPNPRRGGGVRARDTPALDPTAEVVAVLTPHVVKRREGLYPGMPQNGRLRQRGSVPRRNGSRQQRSKRLRSRDTSWPRHIREAVESMPILALNIIPYISAFITARLMDERGADLGPAQQGG